MKFYCASAGVLVNAGLFFVAAASRPQDLNGMRLALAVMAGFVVAAWAFLYLDSDRGRPA